MLFAVRAGHIDAVRALLKAGVDINAITDPTVKPNAKQPSKGSGALSVGG